MTHSTEPVLSFRSQRNTAESIVVTKHATKHQPQISDTPYTRALQKGCYQDIHIAQSGFELSVPKTVYPLQCRGHPLVSGTEFRYYNTYSSLQSLSDHGQEKGRVLPRFTKSSSVGNRLGPANAKQQVPIPEPSKSSGNTSSSHQRDVNSSHGNGSVKAGGIFAFMSKNTGGESSASVHTSNDTRTPTYISSSALNQPTTLATRDAPSPPPSATPGVEGDANIASSNNGAMITMAEVETMLGGLRASLSSIQESRAKARHLVHRWQCCLLALALTTSTCVPLDICQHAKCTCSVLSHCVHA